MGLIVPCNLVKTWSMMEMKEIHDAFQLADLVAVRWVYSSIPCIEVLRCQYAFRAPSCSDMPRICTIPGRPTLLMNLANEQPILSKGYPQQDVEDGVLLEKFLSPSKTSMHETVNITMFQ